MRLYAVFIQPPVASVLFVNNFLVLLLIQLTHLLFLFLNFLFPVPRMLHLIQLLAA